MSHLLLGLSFIFRRRDLRDRIRFTRCVVTN